MTKHYSKGSWYRKTEITTSEADLRWELCSSKTSPERKEEIKKILEEMKSKSDK